ncbi:phage small subunit [Leptolyngbya sp. Heron Island J]|uniref:terminase small subunit n=1 Tax=Leptolyngbya sp. Heron Island J TaxID=1385935 RepID=UPI0003B9A136|nr:terminase small subunit [Leptolyngbya sp. Heron Island J]ESA35938.1 phage small subunit [Leptolyngbya sp. Heron Island J]
MGKKGELTPKQKRFCEEYLVDFNATAAYIRAGYSSKSAATNAGKLLVNSAAQAYLSLLRKRQSASTEVTIERTLAEISRVAFGDVTQVLSFTDSSLTLEDSKSLPQDVTAAIESVTFQENNTEAGTTIRKSVKMHNKMTALSLLADYFGIRDDFNKARATLRRYGIDMVEDLERPLGWRIEPYVANRANT